MIRLLLALILVAALGHALRWLFTRRGKAAVAARTQAPAVPPPSLARRMLTSAGLSLLVGGAAVLLFFVSKLVYLEATKVPLATKSRAVAAPP